MTVFESIEDLKEALLDNSPEAFFDDFVAGKQTPHFGGDKLDFVSEILHSDYGVAPSRDEMVVVGSSKLGFALHEKRRGRDVVSAAFRAYGPESDVDLSICSPAFFDILWRELSAYACKQNYMPFRHKKLGDYLTYGWLRTDQLPTISSPLLVKCGNLGLARGKVRRDRRRGHPKINFGIFHDIDHLKLYQARSIRSCRISLEKPL